MWLKLADVVGNLVVDGGVGIAVGPSLGEVIDVDSGDGVIVGLAVLPAVALDTAGAQQDLGQVPAGEEPIEICC